MEKKMNLNKPRLVSNIINVYCGFSIVIHWQNYNISHIITRIPTP